MEDTKVVLVSSSHRQFGDIEDFSFTVNDTKFSRKIKTFKVMDSNIPISFFPVSGGAYSSFTLDLGNGPFMVNLPPHEYTNIELAKQFERSLNIANGGTTRFQVNLDSSTSRLSLIDLDPNGGAILNFENLLSSGTILGYATSGGTATVTTTGGGVEDIAEFNMNLHNLMRSDLTGNTSFTVTRTGFALAAGDIDLPSAGPPEEGYTPSSLAREFEDKLNKTAPAGSGIFTVRYDNSLRRIIIRDSNPPSVIDMTGGLGIVLGYGDISITTTEGLSIASSPPGSENVVKEGNIYFEIIAGAGDAGATSPITGATLITLDLRNYTATTLATEIELKLNASGIGGPYTVSFNSTTNKLEIIDAGAPNTINFNVPGSAAELTGFTGPAFATTGGTDVGESSVNLNRDMYLHICSDAVQGIDQGVLAINGDAALNNHIIASVPIKEDYGLINYHQDVNDPSIIVNIENSDYSKRERYDTGLNIRFYLNYPLGQIPDLNGINWGFRLIAGYEDFRISRIER